MKYFLRLISTGICIALCIGAFAGKPVNTSVGKTIKLNGISKNASVTSSDTSIIDIVDGYKLVAKSEGTAVVEVNDGTELTIYDFTVKPGKAETSVKPARQEEDSGETAPPKAVKTSQADENFNSGNNILTKSEALELTKAALEAYAPKVTYRTRISKLPQRQSEWDKVMKDLSYEKIDGLDYAFLSGTSMAAEVVDVDEMVMQMETTFKYRTGAEVMRSYTSGASSGSLASSKANSLREACDKIISKLNLDNNDLESVKVKKLHDYLVANSSYDVAAAKNPNRYEDSFDAYGILVKGTGVCQAYAEAMKIILEQVGVQCHYVVGTAPTNVDHAWNRVLLEDGKWYHVDATFDDPVPDEPGRISHDFMFKTDSFMRGKGYKFNDKRAVSNTEYKL